MKKLDLDCSLGSPSLVLSQLQHNMSGNGRSRSRFSLSLDDEEQKINAENDYNEDDIIIAYPSYDESANIFPLFQNDSDLLKYKRLKLGQHIFFLVVPFLLLNLFVFSTRSNFDNIEDFGPYFAAAVTFAILGLLINTVFVTSTLVHYFSEEKHNDWVFFIIATNVLNSQYKQYFDELLLIIVTLCTGFLLYARVREGQCPDMNVWNSQGCNPVSKGTPTDSVLLCYLSPIVLQLLYKGIRINLIFMSWAISTAFIIASIVHVKAWNEIWTILYSLFFLFMMNEIERIMRLSYLQDKKFAFNDIKRREAYTSLKNERTATEKVLFIFLFY